MNTKDRRTRRTPLVSNGDFLDYYLTETMLDKFSTTRRSQGEWRRVWVTRDLIVSRKSWVISTVFYYWKYLRTDKPDNCIHRTTVLVPFHSLRLRQDSDLIVSNLLIFRHWRLSRVSERPKRNLSRYLSVLSVLAGPVREDERSGTVSSRQRFSGIPTSETN